MSLRRLSFSWPGEESLIEGWSCNVPCGFPPTGSAFVFIKLSGFEKSLDIKELISAELVLEITNGATDLRR
jgi:hypothetical protein